MLTTPTSALYMESFGDAAKGKVKAAEREAEKRKKEEEGTKRGTKPKQETKSSSSDSNSEPASPAQRCRAPARSARLQERACAPLLRAGPLGRLQQCACARQQSAVAEGHQGHGAAGMPRPRILANCDDGCNVGSGR